MSDEPLMKIELHSWPGRTCSLDVLFLLKAHAARKPLKIMKLCWWPLNFCYLFSTASRGLYSAYLRGDAWDLKLNVKGKRTKEEKERKKKKKGGRRKEEVGRERENKGKIKGEGGAILCRWRVLSLVGIISEATRSPLLPAARIYRNNFIATLLLENAPPRHARDPHEAGDFFPSPPDRQSAGLITRCWK